MFHGGHVGVGSQCALEPMDMLGAQIHTETLPTGTSQNLLIQWCFLPYDAGVIAAHDQTHMPPPDCSRSIYRGL